VIQDSEYIIKGEDVWIPTVCNGCFNCCGIKVHRVNGKIVNAAGDLKSPNSKGYICAKGKARILDVHHPERVLNPMIRTNPKKGIGVDPKWKEISWDEAMDIIVERMEEVRKEDPRKLIISHFDIPGYRISNAFGTAFGTPNFYWNRADYCGSAAHMAWLTINGSFNAEIDFELCKYVVLWGTQLGHLAETIPLHAAHELAEARRKGAKLVVIDPFCSNAASKADEWIPIKPGTDGAMALAMLNVMLNELKIYDVEFLKKHTNASYLIKANGHYLRDKGTGKPLVWDLNDRSEKVYDAIDLIDPAIDGIYSISGSNCKTAFQSLREHLEKFDVAEMSKITTVSASTIRRITKEFCEAAKIGSTIEVMGQRLPYRPVGVDFKKGASAHKGGFHTVRAMHLLNVLVGAIDVPGSQRGVSPIGPFWTAVKGPDGHIIADDYLTKYSKPYPASEAKIPETLDLRELFPVGLFTRGLYPWGIDEPERFGIPYRPEVLINGRTNLMMSSHNAEAMAETLCKIPFMVAIDMFVNETGEFADIFLPDASDLERWELFPANDPYAFISPGPGYWYWLMRQPVTEPPGEARPWTEIYLEIAERLGFLDELYQIGNSSLTWLLDEKYKLEKGRRYTIREIAEREAKSIIGDDFNWDQLRESPCLITREKTVEEAYPGNFLDSNIMIYMEYLIKTGEDVKCVTDQLGLDWDFRPYTPLPQFIPCSSNEEDNEYDMISVNFKVPFQTFSSSCENLWIDEISRANPYTYNIMVNSSVAEKKGLKSGDLVGVESKYGKASGRLRVTELIHPECVGIAGTFGHWAKKLPIARGKGAFYNDLLPSPSLERIDTISGQVDMCVRVKIYKIME